uniref:Uncharacterized protein n=1 Tax=Salvator merianae TaxID=96440 RepID=A0A8D0DJT3_SALMN
MAQGKQKLQARRPMGSSRKKGSVQGPRKGGIYHLILYNSVFPQNLEVGIRKKIEHEVVMKASAKLPKKLSVLKGRNPPKKGRA